MALPDKKDVFITVVVGASFMLVGLAQLAWVRGFEHGAVRAPGKVIALNAGQAHPEVRFTTERGETIDFAQGGFVSEAVGNDVVVLYHPDNPRDAAVDAFGARYGFPVLSLVMGGLLLGGGLTSLRRRR
jgi:hypothetical protein